MRLATAALILMIASPALAETIAGKASVIDADTIQVNGKVIRFLDIGTRASNLR